MAISNLTFPALPPFSLDKHSAVSTSWRKYKKRFENLVLALHVQDGAQKKALLLNCLGNETYDVYENLSTGKSDKTNDAVTALLDGHFSPQNNITYERYVFQNVLQNVDENFHQFYIRVKEQGVKCDFGATLDT